MKLGLKNWIIDRIKSELKERVGDLDFKTGGKLYHKLEASECMLIKSYEHTIKDQQNATGISCSVEGGSFEFGPILYWLHNPPGDLDDAAKVLREVLGLIEGAPVPQSQITPALYKKIKKQALGPGIVAEDGTIYGDSKYEQLDPGWLFSLLYFIYYQIRRDKIHPFNPNPPKPVELKGTKNGQVSIAVVGDWGTGEYKTKASKDGPAIAVIDAIETLDPDYIVHLGDVYYAGTEGFIETLGEEDEHLMDHWPKRRSQNGTKPGTSFTLNSNHEMYDGANGYFTVALDQKNTPFAAQEKSSFFALEFDPWVIVCFDSAYYSPPDDLFMDGNLGGDDSVQAKWCRENFGDREGKNVIVMTHHNGIDAEGTEQQNPFWQQINSSVNGLPDYWYWGHVHLGVVYGDGLSAADGVKVRCIGHGSIPYGKAWGLENVPDIDYFPKTRVEPNGIRVRNGFAVITLKNDGTLDEVFYEVEDGTSKPIQVWPTPIA